MLGGNAPSSLFWNWPEAQGTEQHSRFPSLQMSDAHQTHNLGWQHYLVHLLHQFLNALPKGEGRFAATHPWTFNRGFSGTTSYRSGAVTISTINFLFTTLPEIDVQMCHPDPSRKDSLTVIRTKVNGQPLAILQSPAAAGNDTSCNVSVQVPDLRAACITCLCKARRAQRPSHFTPTWKVVRDNTLYREPLLDSGDLAGTALRLNFSICPILLHRD